MNAIDLTPWDPSDALVELDRLDCESSLMAFVRHFWPVVEPTTRLVEGRTLDAIVLHLEAVASGDIKRLLINVPPGAMKSLLSNVLFPAWEWTRDPSLRYVTFSYAANLTERDNRKFAQVIQSEEYRRLWPDLFGLTKCGERLVENDATGFKLASSVGGVGTGQRGDRVILDDPHATNEAESDAIRSGTVEWFTNTMSNRLNDMSESAVVVIMQRVHEDDVSGNILTRELGYEHLCIPAEFEVTRSKSTAIGWRDWRSVEGESFWPERYPDRVLDSIKRTLAPFAYFGQYQQRPEPKGGAIIKRDWWGQFTKPKFPEEIEFIVASLDTAYTEKEENDPSALTVWGVYMEGETPRVLLMDAWQERLALHELVEKVFETVSPWTVDRLLIEAKASGISVNQELRRLYGGGTFDIRMINPGRLDKVARAHAVSHLFHEGIVQAPFAKGMPRRFAAPVIDQCASFPRGSHDDLVDSSTQALKHLRDIGLLTKASERAEAAAESARYKGPPRTKIYDI